MHCKTFCIVINNVLIVINIQNTTIFEPVILTDFYTSLIIIIYGMSVSLVGIRSFIATYKSIAGYGSFRIQLKRSNDYLKLRHYCSFPNLINYNFKDAFKS